MAIEIAQNLDAINMVRAQQNVVGRSIIGGAGAVGGGNLIGQGEQTDILTSIQIISEKTFKAIKQQTDTLVKILEFDKKKDRREKEQRAEDKKESKTIGTGIDKKPLDDADGGKEIGGNFRILEFLGIGSLLTNLKKFFAPLGLFVTKIGKVLRLGGLFDRLGLLFAGTGPLAIIAGALFLLFRYSKEIAAALAPAVEGLKQAFDYLKPVFDIILGIGDVIIKTGILAIGTSLTLAFEDLALVIGTLVSSVEFVYNLLKGIVTGDMDLIANAWIKVKSTFASLGDRFINAIKRLYNGIIDALPLPDKIKNKIKLNIDEKAQQQADVGNVGAATNIKEMAKERPEFIGSDGKKQLTFGEAPTKDKPTPDSKKSLFTSGGAYKAKPKTINVDKTTGATQVAEKVMKDEPAEFTTEQREKDIKSLEDFLSGSYSKRKNNLLSDLEAAGVSGPISRTGVDSVSGVDYDKKNAELLEKAKAAGMGFEFEQALMMSLRLREANLAKSDLQMGMPDRPEIMKVFDEANAIKPRVRTTGETLTAKGGQGNVTIVNNQPQNISSSTNVAKTSVSQGSINTSSGDNYFDRQAYNAIV